MNIFNINKKQNLKTNLKAIYDFSKEREKEQRENNEQWEKNFIKTLERIQLNEENEHYLYKTINEFMDNKKQIDEKLNDLEIATNILAELKNKYIKD